MSRLMARIVPTAAVLALLLIGGTIAHAETEEPERGEATITSRSFLQIPAGARVALQIADDSDINLRLRDVASQGLKRAGYIQVTKDPEYTLRLESERLTSGQRIDSSIGSLRYGSGVGRPEGKQSGPQGTGVDLNLKLWSSTRNSLLSPKPGDVAPKQGFLVVIAAFDEAEAKPAWQGIARAPDTGGDPFRVGSAMVKHLVDSLGLTLDEEIVSLR